MYWFGICSESIPIEVVVVVVVVVVVAVEVTGFQVIEKNRKNVDSRQLAILCRKIKTKQYS